MPAKLLGSSARASELAAPPRKAAKPFMDGYRTYEGGAGSPAQWGEAYDARMGVPAATKTVGSDSPYAILGVSMSATWAEIKSAYRKLVLQCHPDKGGKAEDFLKVQAAFEVLEDRIGQR